VFFWRASWTPALSRFVGEIIFQLQAMRQDSDCLLACLLALLLGGGK